MSPAPKNYVIKSDEYTEDDGATPLFWSNEYGWTGFDEATGFSDEEIHGYIMPETGIAIDRDDYTPPESVTAEEQVLRFIQEISVIDPDSGGAVELAVYKTPGGGMLAIDSSFIEQCTDDDEDYKFPSPFDTDTILVMKKAGEDPSEVSSGN